MRKSAKTFNRDMIKRDFYLQKIKNRMHNGMIKVITGIRRCGKSYLLFNIFSDYLKEIGVDDNHIIKIDLEDRRNKELRDPDILLAYIDNRMQDDKMYYILLDEVQKVSEFEDVLNSYLKVKNADVYVTGSNSKFLSKDVITEFRGRGDEIKIKPLSFNEFASVFDNPKEEALKEYILYGGLPMVALTKEPLEKEKYLKDLFETTYLRDIKERYGIKNDAEMGELINIMASTIGGLTNPTKLANTFKSVKNIDISKNTIISYLEILQDVFMVEKSERYDIKGKRYINTPAKYYFEDLGLRNARLNFRQIEETHLMENLIYNELRRRGMSVDVGEVAVNDVLDGKNIRKQLEVDYVCNMGYRRYYIQSAYSVADDDKREQELRPLRQINDSFQKIIIVWDNILRYQNNDGVLFINIYDFLTEDWSFD